MLVDCAMTCIGSRQSLLAEALVAQLTHLESLQDLALPKADSTQKQAELLADQLLIALCIGDRVLTGPVNFTSSGLASGAGSALAVVGPDGAGKSTLLSLVNRRPSARL